MGFWPDWSLKGAHNWFVGGDASKNLPTKPVNYDPVTDRLGKMADGAQGREAPTAQTYQLGQAAQMQASQLAPGQMDQSRGGLMGVAGNLGAVASGQQAGAGEMAVNRQVGSANAGMLGAARNVRGAQGAVAFRNAMRGMSDNSLAGAGMAAQAQAQDQQAANAQLGQIYGGMYGQDASVAAQNAQLGQQASMQNAANQQQAMLQQGQMGQQTNLANLQAQLAQRGMNDQQQIQALGQILGWDQAQIDTQLKAAQIKAGDKGILAGLFGGGGAIMAGS